MTDQTIFEKILSGEIPSYEIGRGNNWYAFLDISPRREGHTATVAAAHLGTKPEKLQIKKYCAS